MQKTQRVLVWGIVLLVLASACNLPQRNSTTMATAMVQTSAAQTVQAVLALSSTPSVGGGETPLPASPVVMISPTITPPLPPPPTGTPSLTPAQPTWTATPAPTPCNVAQFVKDVTVPDGTVFAPGTSFTKTWRLKNVGTCTWQNYSLVFDHGDAMGGPASVPIPAVVPPGQEVDVSVQLTAPNTPGSYKGYWRLRDDKGAVFGLTTGNPFWVEIKVVNPSPTPTPTSITMFPMPTLPGVMPLPSIVVLDFYTQASNATWRNGDNQTLPFPGAANDSRGFARYADNVLLEDGQKYTQVLETHPQWVTDGYITGFYPKVQVPANAHFRAKIGFIALPDGSCGAGEVDFVLYARSVRGVSAPIASWHKKCNGSLQRVDVDLSAYAGKEMYFSLHVDAAGSSGQDWAVWVNPVIETP